MVRVSSVRAHTDRGAVLTSQESWAKGAGAIASFVLRLGNRAIDMLREMEKVEKLSPGVFRSLQGVVVPEDIHVIWSEMDPSVARPTTARFRGVVQKVIQDRHWKWVLLHPALKGSHVHPSRCVPPPLSLQLPTTPLECHAHVRVPMGDDMSSLGVGPEKRRTGPGEHGREGAAGVAVDSGGAPSFPRAHG